MLGTWPFIILPRTAYHVRAVHLTLTSLGLLICFSLFCHQLIRSLWYSRGSQSQVKLATHVPFNFNSLSFLTWFKSCEACTSWSRWNQNWRHYGQCWVNISACNIIVWRGPDVYYRSLHKKAKIGPPSVTTSALAGTHRPIISRNTAAPIPKKQTPHADYQQSVDDIDVLEGSSVMARYILYFTIWPRNNDPRLTVVSNIPRVLIFAMSPTSRPLLLRNLCLAKRADRFHLMRNLAVPYIHLGKGLAFLQFHIMFMFWQSSTYASSWSARSRLICVGSRSFWHSRRQRGAVWSGQFGWRYGHRWQWRFCADRRLFGPICCRGRWLPRYGECRRDQGRWGWCLGVCRKFCVSGSFIDIPLNYLTSPCSEHSSVVAGPSSSTVYLEDIESTT